MRWRVLARYAAAVLPAGVLGGLLLWVLAAERPCAVPVGDALARRALADTGCRNAVAAIYLGYRSFDTLGEGLVFLVSVAGAVALRRKG